MGEFDMAGEDFMLTDQVAVVTGGGGGIGAGIALKLAEYGAHVAVLDIVPERADDIAGKIRRLGRRGLPLPTDCRNSDQVRDAIGEIDSEFGRIDILVNNAGGVVGRPFLKQSERSWRNHIDYNLVSMLAATAAVAPIMIRESRGGSMINVSSIEGQRAAPNFAVYAACKAGMLSFTRSMALELSQHGIRVNAIAPDHTVTPGMRGNVGGPVDESQWINPSPEEQDALDRIIPLGREGHVDEIGNAAVYLSSRMAEYVTGVTLNVDGGTWASSGWLRDRQHRWVQHEGVVLVDEKY
jgi:NAD(P)-dependent dehydrogenase (short-subunit alcohol dehydrogenase family)